MMAHFYGELQGNRGVTTRCGSKGSGIYAHLKSWENNVWVTLRDLNGKDALDLDIPKGLAVKINGIEYTIDNDGLAMNREDAAKTLRKCIDEVGPDEA